MWNADDCTRAYWQRGGASLLRDLINAVAKQLRQSGLVNYEVTQAASHKPVPPSDDEFT